MSIFYEIEFAKLIIRYRQSILTKINFNADEEMATVCGANPAWIRKMDALVKDFPDVFPIKR